MTDLHQVHKENVFEKELVEYLGTHGWKEGSDTKYDKELALYPEDLLDFVKETQPTEWAKFVRWHNSHSESMFLKRVAEQLDRHGTLFLLRFIRKSHGAKKMPPELIRKSGRVEVQPAAMKIDRNLEAFLVPKSVGPFLDRLDLGVQPFARGIGDRMRDIGQDIGEMPLDQVGDLSHGFQSAMSSPPEPAFPEGLGFPDRRETPEGPEIFLHGPGPSDLQVQGAQGVKSVLLRFGKILLRIQPQIFGPFQLRDFSVPGFPLPDGIHGLSDMAHDMVPVKDDLLRSFGNMPEGRLEERVPHVHGNRPDPVALFRRERLVECLQCFGLSTLSHVFDRSLPKVAHQRHGLVSLGKRLFVPPDVNKRLFSLSIGNVKYPPSRK